MSTTRGGRTSPPAVVPPAQRTTSVVGSHRPDPQLPETRPAFRPLPADLRDMLRDGVGPDRTEQRSAVRRVTIGAINAGWNFADFDAAMNDPRNGLITWFLERDDRKPRNARATSVKIRREWDRAREWLIEHPAITNGAEARQQIGLWTARLDELDWSGRSGLRDRAIYVQLLKRGTEIGTLTPQISVRTLCEATPYRGFKTVSRALESLEQRQLLKPKRVGGSTDATAYELLSPPSKQSAQVTHNYSPFPGGDSVSVVRSADKALGLAFGAHAAAVYAALSDEVPLMPTAIARRANVSVRTANNKLKLLGAADVGLARRTPDGWVSNGPDPALVAAEHGAMDAEIDRTFKHAVQRHNWQNRETARRSASKQGDQHPLPDPRPEGDGQELPPPSAFGEQFDSDLWAATLAEGQGR